MEKHRDTYPGIAKIISENLSMKETVKDRVFSTLLTSASRRDSKRHWTSLAVAKRAAELLTGAKQCRVLDVGSGVGKFCIVGSLTTPAHFVGIERREALVREARELSAALGATRTEFVCGDISTVDWRSFDAFYLFNPFLENIDQSARIDLSFDYSQEKYAYFVEATRTKLQRAKRGTRVVTYHGFGGAFPSGYQRELREPWEEDYLELWVHQG
jgi:SAM-dependent methyltransferase